MCCAYKNNLFKQISRCCVYNPDALVEVLKILYFLNGYLRYKSINPINMKNKIIALIALIITVTCVSACGGAKKCTGSRGTSTDMGTM